MEPVEKQRPVTTTPLRVGVVSPNILLNVADINRMYEDPTRSWRFEGIAKRAALLFDKIYITHDLQMTCELLEGFDDGCEDSVHSATIRFLAEQGLILTPQELGYSSGDQFVQANMSGVAAEIHAHLVQVGNPGVEGDEDYLIGQPDVGDLAEHDGCHPRGRDGDQRQHESQLYESLLLRRNAALLRQVGIPDVAIVGRLLEEQNDIQVVNPIWKVIVQEMPQIDACVSWDDLFDFRREERTQHLIRSLRRWVRKLAAENWTEAELQDEIRELVFEYENHLRLAHMKSAQGPMEFLIVGAADLVEDILKLRTGKIGRLAYIFRERRVRLLDEEAKAPGRELALFSELRTRWGEQSQ